MEEGDSNYHSGSQESDLDTSSENGGRRSRLRSSESPEENLRQQPPVEFKHRLILEPQVRRPDFKLQEKPRMRNTTSATDLKVSQVSERSSVPRSASEHHKFLNGNRVSPEEVLPKKPAVMTSKLQLQSRPLVISPSELLDEEEDQQQQLQQQSAPSSWAEAVPQQQQLSQLGPTATQTTTTTESSTSNRNETFETLLSEENTLIRVGDDEEVFDCVKISEKITTIESTEKRTATTVRFKEE